MDEKEDVKDSTQETSSSENKKKKEEVRRTKGKSSSISFIRKKSGENTEYSVRRDSEEWDDIEVQKEKNPPKKSVIRTLISTLVVGAAASLLATLFWELWAKSLF